MFIMKIEYKDKCSTECKGSKNNTECCFQKCYCREKGVLVDGKFNKDKLIKLFSEAEENLMKDWKSVIKKSVAGCEKQCKKFKSFNQLLRLSNFGVFVDPADEENADNEKDCVPEYFNQIVICTLVENFINCPDFNKAKECKTMKKSVNDCYKEGHRETLVPLMIFSKGKRIEE